MRTFSLRRWLGLALVVLALGAAAVDTAEARRGGSFGSRGGRTYQAPPATNTLPNQAAPVNRSMTPRTQANQPNAAQPGAAQAGRSGMFGGMAGGLLGGLMLGGLIGMLMGNGLGGMAGMLGMLLQIGIIALIAMLALRYFRSRQQPAMAGAGATGPLRREGLDDQAPRYAAGGGNAAGGNTAGGNATRGLGLGSLGVGAVPSVAPVRQADGSQWSKDEIGITESDLSAFETLLEQVQTAFGREDYAGLRRVSTPEIMSYLSEELSQNAVNGVRNQVTDVKLLQGDVSEAWREDNTDYATVALRYESRDVMVERDSGNVVSGDPENPTETAELWTFVRPRGEDWKLSAIQEA